MRTQPHVAEPSLLMSIDDACQMLSVRRTLLYAEIRAGRLRIKKIGRRTLIDRRDLERFAAEL